MCVFRSHTIVPFSSPHNPLDVGLHIDGLSVLELWHIVIEVLRTTKDNIHLGHTSCGKLEQTQPDHTSSGKLEYVQHSSTICDSRTKIQRVNRRQGTCQLNEVDYVPTNTRSSEGESLLYIFEDNETVIKMIMTGRSLRMRHVENSR